MMKNRIERLVVLPFTAGCVSSSSVAVCVQHGRRPTEDIKSSQIVYRSPEIPWDPKEKEGIPISSENTMRSSLRFLALSKPNVSTGFQRLTKSIRSLSQSIVFKDHEIEEVEIELEIGLPTDVKHVAHIGLDGSTNPSANCCNHVPADFLSLCNTLSSTEIEQFPMPEQMDASHLQDMLSNTPYATHN